ncbi:Eco57I restriction-modification methylase domain-containing protein [Aquimarina hainanensis]|uniref:site-specific DNA-methyltransferase (adenine-specific) n=1 Tax=Aquimarina hainanensis TaxID=1578017 RepID=A0ABW5NDU2_9FLAO
MAYIITHTKEEGLAQIKKLVRKFHDGIKDFKEAKYNETLLRSDFLDPLLMSLGWDVFNQEGKSQFLRYVIQEESIEVDDSDSKKSPDYTLRVERGERKLFVEAKKPSVKISESSKAAFQTKRYGWNGNLGISVLSNFDELIIYDCRNKPNNEDNEHVGRVRVFKYSEFISAFDELYDLISFDSACNGRIDELFSTYERTGEAFDDYFLQQIENWRSELAESAIKKNNELTSEDINFLIQRLLNRIVFLRICEDRTIEKFETLKNISDYEELKELFIQSDKKYNSGLFDFIEDSLSLVIDIETETLLKIFNELYFPQSPFNFSVVDPTILSQIYERFLGSRVEITNTRQLSIVSEPEVSASNGVVPTPKIIVENIVTETLLPLFEDKSLDELKNLKVADICCGSGTFLISVFDFFIQQYSNRVEEEGIENNELTHKLSDGTHILTLKTKREILTNNIHGVDVNPYAVEVTEFSLLLKLLEGENEKSIDDFISTYKEKILPSLSNNLKCGNSLVDEKFYEFLPSALEDDNILFRVKPFDWNTEFPFLNESNGFDAIIGNPPYVRIQNLVKYSPEEVLYYQSTTSDYSVAKKDSIDKYYVFIQRAIELLNPKGYLGYIIPNKFFIIKAGKALRKFIKENSYLSKIVHFGVTQVFPDKLTYTAILILQKEELDQFDFKRVQHISSSSLTSDVGVRKYEQAEFSQEPWVFLSEETEVVLKKMYSDDTAELGSLADLTVGLQTSADKIYIFKPTEETESTYKFEQTGQVWEIEKDICQSCIYGLTLRLFDTISENAKMIFPYSISDGKAEIIQEEVLQENFPLAWKYLNHHKAKLEQRSINGSKDPKWYQFGRSQSLTKFHSGEKLIWSVIANQPTYVLDNQNLQFTGGGNGPYYSLINQSDLSILYFLAILGHPIVERMVQAGASEFQGNYYSHGKQFLERIPIKLISSDTDKEKYEEIIKTVKELIKAKSKFNSLYGAKRIVYQRKLDTLNSKLITIINELYGISSSDYDTVINDEMFSNELIAEE